MKFPRFLIPTFFCFIFVYCKGQNTVITGTVYDVQTREPIPFAGLQILNTDIGTTTNIDGEYRIETTGKADSIVASFIGYKRDSKPVKWHESQKINFFLESYSPILQEVVIKPGENPAYRILRKVVQHKLYNDAAYLNSYQYDSYNKIEFDLNNIPKSYEEKKVLNPLKFAFNYIDSSNVKEKPYLPAFISESVSGYYYRNSPKEKKEIIKASQFSGFKNQSISQFMGDMYQNVDVYKNTFILFGQEFNSPISNNWISYYKYYLIDSMVLNGHYCYQLEFKPKHTQEFGFSGNMWISDTTFALVRLEMNIPRTANLNYVQSFSVLQEYDFVDNSQWMLAKDKLIVDFALSKKSIGMYGRKTTYYYNFVINKPMPRKFYSIINNLIVEDNADNRSKQYWDSVRHVPLTKQENNIYAMVDTFQSLPIYNHVVNAVILLVTGYKNFGLIDFGPVFDFLSFNTVEGTRVKLGGRTSNGFSDWYELSGYAAYGTTDKQMKYKIGYKAFITKKPWQQVEMHYTDDYQILGRTDNLFNRDNILTSLLARAPVSNLTRVIETKFTYDRDWFPGLELKLSLFDRVFIPLQNNLYQYYGSDGQLLDKPSINSPALQAHLIFAYDDKYIISTMSRADAGTKYPTLQVQYTAGFKGIFEGDYQYRKLVSGINYISHLNPLGDLHYYVEGGKIWGVVPYPLMFLHPGNETYIYDPTAYNLMNYYEFASDAYLAINLEHHFEGFFFSKIPGFRNLKWREVVGYKWLMGSVNSQNENAILFPSTLSALNNGPYEEADVGIENILKVIRVDAVWRLSYLSDQQNAKISRFGVLGTFQLIF